jgi:hypothetical protein
VSSSVRTAAPLVALPALLLAAALPAQAPGDLVRVRGEPTAPWRTGRLVARTDSALVLRVDREYVRDTAAGGATRGRWMPAGNDTIPLAAVRQLEVRRHAANRGRRAALGAVGGVAVGALLGAALGSQAEGGESDMAGLATVVFAGVGGLTGLVVGTVAGATSAKPTRWESVVLPAQTPR